MTKLPALSVIMLTYNRQHLVARMIESVLCQTFSDFEYIIIDNGSIDRSGKICGHYARQDRRIRFLSKPRGSIGSGRNAGLNAAAGNYIAFVDDDDICEPDMLEFLYRLAEQYEADIAICGSRHIYPDRIEDTFVFPETLILGPEEAEVAFLQRKKFNTGFPAKMIKRKLFAGSGFDDEKKFDDIGLFYKIIARAGRVVCRGEAKYICARHENNNSAFTDNDRLITPAQLNEYFLAYRERTLFLAKRFPASRDFFHYAEWSFLISMCRKIIANNLPDCQEQLQYARNFLHRDKPLFLNSPFIKNFEREWMEKYL